MYLLKFISITVVLSLSIIKANFALPYYSNPDLSSINNPNQFNNPNRFKNPYQFNTPNQFSNPNYNSLFSPGFGFAKSNTNSNAASEALPSGVQIANANAHAQAQVLGANGQSLGFALGDSRSNAGGSQGPNIYGNSG